MKNTKLLLAIATSAALLTGCQNTHGINPIWLSAQV